MSEQQAHTTLSDAGRKVLAEVLGEYARNGWLNLVGGCCGTVPAHIAAIAKAVEGVPPRRPASPSW